MNVFQVQSKQKPQKHGCLLKPSSVGKRLVSTGAEGILPAGWPHKEGWRGAQNAELGRLRPGNVAQFDRLLPFYTQQKLVG